ncbi:hypothetical protein AVEN_4389-1 [Araneus ventricosus]|uniref:Fibrinogen C-terminal domain-containing protein n=1 Tax=Araneus ventricosus TaxID=182803 RepID=A0A4Y2X389_ARAVE|nr:hypothetical protein AVEN_4389-1 [Araneus ventricosus]
MFPNQFQLVQIAQTMITIDSWILLTNSVSGSKPIEKDDKIVQDDKPRDCSEILASGRNKSGVHTIWAGEPFPAGKPLQVYCDMETDKGGWTVILFTVIFTFQPFFTRGGYRCCNVCQRNKKHPPFRMD